MQSAFVDIGLDRDAFLYVSDFFEDNDEYDKIVTSVEEKVLKLDRTGQPVRSGRGSGAGRQRLPPEGAPPRKAARRPTVTATAPPPSWRNLNKAIPISVGKAVVKAA